VRDKLGTAVWGDELYQRIAEMGKENLS
jgi:hypothetical protein